MRTLGNIPHHQHPYLLVLCCWLSLDPFITNPRVTQPTLTLFQRVPWFPVISCLSLGTNKINCRVDIYMTISSSRACMNTAKLWRCKYSKLRLNAIPLHMYHVMTLIETQSYLTELLFKHLPMPSISLSLTHFSSNLHLLLHYPVIHSA